MQLLILSLGFISCFLFLVSNFLFLIFGIGRNIHWIVSAHLARASKDLLILGLAKPRSKASALSEKKNHTTFLPLLFLAFAFSKIHTCN